MHSSSLLPPPELFSTGTLIVDGSVVNLPQLPTVRQLVAQRPQRARVFEKYGISYCCCAGNQSFQEACAAQNVDAKVVLSELVESDARPHLPEVPSREEWSPDRAIDLCRHIEEVHHVFLKTELPRLAFLIGRVAARHGAIYNELWELQELFEEFKEEASWHLQREEEQLHPLLEQLNNPGDKPSELRAAIDKVVCTLDLEHAYLSQAMAHMNALTSGFQLPGSACNTLRVMINSLEELGQHILFYMDTESNFLFAWAQKTQIVTSPR